MTNRPDQAASIAAHSTDGCAGNGPTAPRVSVVLPCYNRAWSVAAAVASVLAQDYTDFELIVVDDGSHDETRACLAPFGDRLRLVRQQHRGVSAARNRGVREARGELIAFLDSDDLWRPPKLTRQTAYFDAHPEALICQTEEIWLRRGRRVNPKTRHRKPSGWIFVPSLELCLVSPSAVMLHRRLWDAVGGFDEDLPACEDYDLWLRVSCRYPIHLIDEPLVVKQGGHADQLSRAPGLDRYRIRALEKIIASAWLTPDQRRAAIDTLRRKCAIYAGGCRKRGRIDEALSYERLAAQYAPSEYENNRI
jgi:glycosyltransferase involved in cell wall biosynthesis